MDVIKRYNHGGVHYDTPKTKRELRREKREDEKGMIPARFRNRGQEGLDAYRAMMKRRGGKDFNLWRALKSLLQKQRGFNQKEEGHCVGGNCGQFG
jgi:hypothetical protein